MLALTNMPYCGFGNRLIYYYNLRQEAIEKICGYHSAPWEGHQHFEGDLLRSHHRGSPHKVYDLCLGDKFFSYNKTFMSDIFVLKKTPDVRPNTCAVHFRGGDFHSWNPDAILKYEYYHNSIEDIKDKVSNFVLFTDDTSLDSYEQTKKYLENKNINYSIGVNSSNRSNYIDDFSFMSECDWMISSPSTFCISAGAIGRKKNIIHSKDWIQNRIDNNDKFWVDLNNGGNSSYSVWKYF
jgi:hypothetical protein